MTEFYRRNLTENFFKVIYAGESIVALCKFTIRTEFRQVKVDRCLFDRVKENVLMDYRSYV